jgi:hypothetical protein
MFTDSTRFEDSHGGGNVVCGLLGCDAVWSCRRFTYASEESIASIFRVQVTNKTTRRHNPDDHNRTSYIAVVLLIMSDELGIM